MPKVRFRLPVSIEVSDGTLRVLESSAPLVRAIRQHGPALLEVKDAAVVLGREIGRAIKAEQARRPKKPRRRRT